MSDDKPTFVVKRRDLADIIKLQDEGALEEFLQDPFAVIAALSVDLFERGPVAAMGPGVRIVQGALKGRLFQQLAKEVRDLREKGKIGDNFAEKKYGYQTWVELLTAIDEDRPDEDRLEAMKAMFFAANKINATDAEQILGYQLFQIAKNLTSNELLVLKAVYELAQNRGFGDPGQIHNFSVWAEIVAKRLGHGLISLIDHADAALEENRLLSTRWEANRAAVHVDKRGRLTDLGWRFCENIEKYRIDKAECSAPSKQE